MHFHRGIGLRAGGDLPGALAAFSATLQLDPDHPGALEAQAAALSDLGRHEQALAALAVAMERHPGHAALLRRMGTVLLRLDRAQQAIGALLLAAEADPDDPATPSALGIAFLHCDALDHARHYAGTAYRMAPDYDRAVNYSRVLLEAGAYAEALSVSAHATAQWPAGMAARNNHALALEGLGRREDAVRAWQDALALAPDDPDLCHQLSTLLLAMGRLTPETWALYERRLNGRAALGGLRRWRGEGVAGKTVLLHAEQGFGDTMQFVRYAPLVAARGARVVLAVQPSLTRLLAATPGVDQVVAVGGPLPAFDLFCPLLSLPAIFATRLDSVPPPLPYAIPAVPRAPGPLRVGLVWAGNPGFSNDRRRSVAPELLAPLVAVAGVQCVGLQTGLAEIPAALPIPNALAGVGDFADTAARIAGLDLVVAVDTAVAHLAATMGKPVWLLSRHLGCWRWLQDRTDSPWYPGMRLYRQARANDWAEVIARVHHDLRQVAAAG